MDEPEAGEGGRRRRGARAPRRRRGRHPHRVPRPDRRRAAALRQALRGRRRRLQGLQEHPGPLADRRRPPRGPRRRFSTGPTAIAFVSGDVAAVAKALRDFARTYPSLVVKGGLHGDGLPVDPGADRPGRPAAARCAAGPVGRGDRRAAAAVRRPPAGASPQSRLRAVGPARRAGRSSGRRCGRGPDRSRGRGRDRRRRARSQAEPSTEATPSAEAAPAAEEADTAEAPADTAEAARRRGGRGQQRRHPATAEQTTEATPDPDPAEG